MAGNPSAKNTPVAPTSEGKDLDSADGTIDGHIRLETYKHLGTKIYVDLFDSSIRNPSRAHIISEMFPYTNKGARESTRFLQGNGFQAEVMLRQPR
jgi:hypothetical protein